MAYKCRICGTVDVENPGDICELCAIGQDPYAQGAAGYPGNPSPRMIYTGSAAPQDTKTSSGRSRKVLLGGGQAVSNTDPYGNSMTVTEPKDSGVQVYKSGQVPSSPIPPAVPVTGSAPAQTVSKNGPLCEGVTKNISVDNTKKASIVKIFETLFKGVPFAFDDDITLFQVFPDYTGTSLNAQGYACDQVIVYGKLNAGAVSENNSVEVYGHRDSGNNIIASKIVNKATGTTVTPQRVLSAGVMWILVALLVALLAVVVGSLGVNGIIWAVVIVLCLTNLPLVLKIIAAVLAFIFSIFRGANK